MCFRTNVPFLFLPGLLGRGRLDDGVRKLDFGDWDNAWVEVGIRNGDWTPGFNVVAPKDLPDSTYSWSLSHDDLIKNDSKGNCYALLETIKPGFFKATYSMTYLVKDGDNWSAALTLRRSRGGWRGSRTLGVDDFSNAFAAWVNKERKFVGRWIRPRGIGLLQS